jgi:hypothetical protein
MYIQIIWVAVPNVSQIVSSWYLVPRTQSKEAQLIHSNEPSFLIFDTDDTVTDTDTNTDTDENVWCFFSLTSHYSIYLEDCLVHKNSDVFSLDFGVFTFVDSDFWKYKRNTPHLIGISIGIGISTKVSKIVSSRYLRP